MHKHIFKHIGGGCLMNMADPYACDDHYKCKCGLDFKLKTSFTGHRYLPESFEAEEMSELKNAENEAIGDAIDDNLISYDHK